MLIESETVEIDDDTQAPSLDEKHYADWLGRLTLADLAGSADDDVLTRSIEQLLQH